MSAQVMPASDARRDPAWVARAARGCWTSWEPGDGTAYWVRIVPINDGPKAGDRVLLLHCCERTIAVQYPTVEYWLREYGRWTQKRWRAEQLPAHLWQAVQPLLRVEGVAR